ncbi:MAG: hypothetical protein ACR2N0_16160, partial [Rubrobacteraceae bacterium]
MSEKINRDRTLVRYFQREIERQCQFAMISLQDMDQATEEGNGIFFWYSVQSLFVSVGRVSRMLWPEDPSQPELREELRRSLDVAGESPIIPPEVISKFEDFDLVLEAWYTSSEARRFFDLYTEPLDVLGETGPGDRFRGYHTENKAVLFNGEAYPTAPISRFVEELAVRAAHELAKPRFDT